jgi:hypothetical protein
VKSLKETPWDKKVYGIETYELEEYSESLLLKTDLPSAHFTLKVDPLADKSLLHKYGFYYADTLIKPYCKKEWFKGAYNSEVSLSHSFDLEAILKNVGHNFQHSRFHRDFNLEKDKADERYLNWLTDLYNKNSVHAYYYKDRVVGFFAYSDNQILLHALDSSVKGKGLAKYFWTLSIEELFTRFNEVESSISATNMPVLNLYSSLGFKFKEPVDVYHKFTKKLP